MIDNPHGKEYTIERLGKSNIRDLDKLHTVVFCQQQPAGYLEKNMTPLILVLKI